jgi:hypothetical protein
MLVILSFRFVEVNIIFLPAPLFNYYVDMLRFDLEFFSLHVLNLPPPPPPPFFYFIRDSVPDFSVTGDGSNSPPPHASLTNWLGFLPP